MNVLELGVNVLDLGMYIINLHFGCPEVSLLAAPPGNEISTSVSTL